MRRKVWVFYVPTIVTFLSSLSWASGQNACLNVNCAAINCSLQCLHPCGWVSNADPMHCVCGAHTDPTTELVPGGLGPDGGPCQQFAPTTVAPTTTPPNCTAILCARECSAPHCGWSSRRGICRSAARATTTTAELGLGVCTSSPTSAAPTPRTTVAPVTATTVTSTFTVTTSTTARQETSSPEPLTLPEIGSVIGCRGCAAGTAGPCAYLMPNGARLCFPLAGNTAPSNATVDDCPPAAAHITVTLCTVATTTAAPAELLEALPSCNNCTFGTTGECREDITGVCTPYKNHAARICYPHARSCATVIRAPADGECYHCSEGTDGPCQRRGANSTARLPCFPRMANGRCQAPLEACAVFQSPPVIIPCTGCAAGSGECYVNLDNGLKVCYPHSHCALSGSIAEGFQVCTQTINDFSHSEFTFP